MWPGFPSPYVAIAAVRLHPRAATWWFPRPPGRRCLAPIR